MIEELPVSCPYHGNEEQIHYNGSAKAQSLESRYVPPSSMLSCSLKGKAEVFGGKAGLYENKSGLSPFTEYVVYQ